MPNNPVFLYRRMITLFQNSRNGIEKLREKGMARARSEELWVIATNERETTHPGIKQGGDVIVYDNQRDETTKYGGTNRVRSDLKIRTRMNTDGTDSHG